MLILSLDSASDGCSACVWRDEQVLSLVEERMDRGQDRRLLPVVMAAMERASITFDDLDRIAVTRGPGSFTGLRIGLAAARGLGIAANKPVVGIDRFAIFHAQVPDADSNHLVVINSKRKELYAQFYPSSGKGETPIMLPPDALAVFATDKANSIISGDTKIEGIRHQPAAKPEVVICAALAAQADVNDPQFLPRPLYIRPPDVTIKAPRIDEIKATHAMLLAQLHKESFGPVAWTPEQILGSLALDTTKGWIAYQNNEPAGFVLCQMGDGQSEILTFCVHPIHQRLGIGSKLMAEALRMARAANSDLFLEVAADNVAAIQLYEKAGFQVSGKRPNYYKRENGTIDAILYTAAAPQAS